MQTFSLDGDVNRVGGGNLDERSAHHVDVSVCDRQLIGNHRIPGKAKDPIDVPVAGGDGRGDCSKDTGAHFAADHRHRRSGPVLTGCVLNNFEVEAKVVFPAVEQKILDDRVTGWDVDEDVEGESTPNNNLFDIEQIRGSRFKNSHEPCGDARTVQRRYPDKNSG